MGCVYRRGDAKRGSPYFIKYRDASGKWRYEKGYIDKQATKQFLARREREVAQGKEGLDDPYEDHRKTALAQHIKDFETHLKARGGSPRYVRNMKGYLTRACHWMGVTAPDDLSAHKAERLLLALRDGTIKTKASASKEGKSKTSQYGD